MFSVLASSAVDNGFEPRSGQAKDYRIGSVASLLNWNSVDSGVKHNNPITSPEPTNFKVQKYMSYTYH
jgi:hypothetical protein